DRVDHRSGARLPGPVSVPLGERQAQPAARSAGAAPASLDIRCHGHHLFIPLRELMIELPSYREQAPDVAAHHAEIRERPVVMTVGSVGRVFDSPQGPITALSNIEFEVHRREFISVIGPSGCGKSTLIRIVAGLESCTDGAVLIDGHPVLGPGPDRGMVFQSYTLFPWLTVRRNVM